MVGEDPSTAAPAKFLLPSPTPPLGATLAQGEEGRGVTRGGARGELLEARAAREPYQLRPNAQLALVARATAVQSSDGIRPELRLRGGAQRGRRSLSRGSPERRGSRPNELP